jgi:DNA mismatch repair protein MutS
MYDKYISAYKHHSVTYGPNTAIFMLVGSFYELYDIVDPSTGEGQTSMKRAVEILGIQLVKKDKDAPKGRDGYFAGFKDAQLHKYATPLTREGWTVVVIDQMKDDSGRVQSREVSRILSPATHVEASQSDTLYLGGLWMQAASWTDTGLATPPTFAAVAADLMTGAMHTYEGATTGRTDAWSSDGLLHFFQVHPPKELIVWWRGHALDQPSEQTLRRSLGVAAAPIYVRQALPFDQGGLEKEIVREDVLRRCFQLKTLLPLKDALGLREKPLTERALVALYNFIEDHHPSCHDRLRPPAVWNPADSVYLGNHALTQLNMVTAREDDSVLGMFLRTNTQMGRRGMRRRILYPISSVAELERRYEQVGWCKDGASQKMPLLRGQIRQIQDMAKLHRRITTATVGAADVLALDQSYVCSRRCMELLQETPLDATEGLAIPFKAYLNEFIAVFDIEKAKQEQEDQFCLTAAAGPLCAGIEEKIAAALGEIRRIHEEFVAWLQEDITTLRMEFKESTVLLVGGKGVMTRAAAKLKAANIPADFQGAQIHAKKSSSTIELPSIHTRYMQLLRLRDRLQETVKEELPRACDQLLGFSTLWDQLEAWVSTVDVSMTLARVAEERGFCRPVVEGGDVDQPAFLEAAGLRHPLIEAQATRLEYVRHDVSLGAAAASDEQGWLVYGMNASGKSSLMKAIGIATILAQVGSFVPASTFRFRPFRGLYTRILNTDNLWAGLSSFAVEMTELGEILRRADPWSLVLGDEVCSGTESSSAIGLVGGTLVSLMSRGARFMFATHLHGLQAVSAVAALKALKVWHLRVEHDYATGRLVYDRTLHPGPGSSLYGLEVAKAMGIPLEVLEIAHQIRREVGGSTTDMEAPKSGWNAAVVRRACELCKKDVVRELEAHHVVERATAIAGRLEDGSNMNDLRNMAVLCEACHLKTHSGEAVVGPVKMTSDGPERQVVTAALKPQPQCLESFAYTGPLATAGGLTPADIETIKAEIRAYPKVAPTRLIFDIEQKHGIKITVQRLGTIRRSIK